MPPGPREGESLERVGDLLLAQPEKGYRYGLDPFLLVHFIGPPGTKARERVVDIGTGCGIIALLLARLRPAMKVWAVEIQEGLAAMARENTCRNGLEGRCEVIAGDARAVSRLLPQGRFDRVVSNPPFRAPGAGRVCPEPQRALARQELALPLPSLVAAASRLLRSGGNFEFLHLPERLPEVFEELRKYSLEPKRLRLVHSFADAPAVLALVSARRGGRPGLTAERPFVIYSTPGRYTAEARRVIPGGEGRSRPPIPS